jgi:hypothetical protein
MRPANKVQLPYRPKRLHHHLPLNKKDNNCWEANTSMGLSRDAGGNN